ncbi:MAG: diacylglycerol kinase [Alphaproteobacteria bacterium]|jgi:diacylglycerol kinase (ATP)|nr:diacylglycerol kinase [Alphaproteobacteria bacterium]MBU1549387.1 diacylglycerol kinase [Alphaproteobacteria bacterium]MBU2338152.1 diacylglycerol kinase [Alphaproteobacteria bacterium]MBU2387539.1 diacylglycerol kinase [Alphaproteobacteria bacterium]|tara:strand:- start:850 stop:1233 length:384 start_codon:yes stop_codon:yes gene_type:complete
MSGRSGDKKLVGVAHLLAAGRYSAGGFFRACKEAAFRQELAAGAGLCLFYFYMDVEPAVGIAAAILFLLLMAVEALNTAIEEIVDRISPEISDTGRHAKNLGSFAVLCLVIANMLLPVHVIAVSVWL